MKMNPPNVVHDGNAMSIDLDVTFDPYAAWLHVHEKQRPLNPYQLLNLKTLEADFTKIRGAISRQQSLVDACRDGADPELWRRIKNELDDAIATMLDPDRKLLLDAALKRQSGRRPGVSPPPAPPINGGGTITCRICQTDNPSHRRFCGQCGSSLLEKCPACDAELTAGERFCGHCGTNLEATLRQQEQRLQQLLDEAHQLRQEYRFDEAVSALRKVAVVDDVRFDRFAQQALALLEQFAQDRRALEEQGRECLQTAKDCMNLQAYEKAAEKLETIPPSLRTAEIVDVLNEACRSKNELRQLSGEIRDALAQNRRSEVLPKIERLLVLKPNHAQARQLAEQIRDDVCKAAKKHLAAHRYDEARMLLESIPAFARNELVEALADKARELDSLATNVRLSPLVDAPLLALAERLVKLSPADEAAQKQLAEIRQRASSKPAEAPLACPSWSPPPRRTLNGLPVHGLGHITRCDIPSSEVAATLREHPGQFFVALGLALQAKEQASIALNLAPIEKTGLLGSFSLSLRKPQPKGGWGLDLGATGLRGIKLAPEVNQGRVRIEAAVYIPHARSLGTVDDDILQSEIALATLKSFAERHPFAKQREKRDNVVVALSGARVLGRFFDLPPVSAKKLTDVVQFEARHQVPIPLEDLSWGYHAVDKAEGNQADENARHIMLLAAKEFHVTERLGLFRNAGIPVDSLTAEPLALHNAIVYELLDGGQQERRLALLDIGAQGSNFVVSSRKGVWFRASGNSGEDFTNLLVKQFQLTHALADELKRAPQKARRFYQLHAAWQPCFVQFGSEIERSLVLFAKHFPDQPIESLYLAGGGAATHGLLRYLVHGQ